jgi:hypothetical protein
MQISRSGPCWQLLFIARDLSRQNLLNSRAVSGMIPASYRRIARSIRRKRIRRRDEPRIGLYGIYSSCP